MEKEIHDFLFISANRVRKKIHDFLFIRANRVRKRNTRFSFYKSKPCKNTRLQRLKDLEHAKNEDAIKKLAWRFFK